MIKKEYRLQKSGKTAQTWSIWVDGDTVTTLHGQVGSASLQEYSDIPGPKGKEGTKAWMSAADNAQFAMDREIRKKTESGYREWQDGAFIGEARQESIDFSQPLPKHFCSYKPKTSIEPDALAKLEKKGNLIFTRKVNGFCHVAAHQSDGWHVYSRRMDDLSAHFPHHIERLSTLKNMKIGTILVGEMVVWDANDKDDFKKVSSFCRSLAPEARKLVTNEEVAEPTFVVFDMLFNNGKDLKDESYRKRSAIWRDQLLHLHPLVRPIGLVKTTAAAWETIVKENAWEGLVAVDGETPPGDKFYSFTAKSERPNCSFKLKPVWTEDVVVYAARPGQGKRLSGIGAVHTAQLNAEGEWFSCGAVGSGFTEDDLVEMEEIFAKGGLPILAKDKDVEKINLNTCKKIVVEVEYRERQPGTNKFQHPVFIRVRTDKTPEECIQQRIAEEPEEGQLPPLKGGGLGIQ